MTQDAIKGVIGINYNFIVFLCNYTYISLSCVLRMLFNFQSLTNEFQGDDNDGGGPCLTVSLHNECIILIVVDKLQQQKRIIEIFSWSWKWARKHFKNSNPRRLLYLDWTRNIWPVRDDNTKFICSVTRPLIGRNCRDTVLWLVEIIMLLRLLSYAIKNQLKAPKAPY